MVGLHTSRRLLASSGKARRFSFLFFSVRSGSNRKGREEKGDR